MKFSLDWLKEHLTTSASTEVLVESMTAAGLEVEDVRDASEMLGSLSVARIHDVKIHEGSSRLRVCEVETADGFRQVVCGAPNARPGLTTIYAPIGTTMAGIGVISEKLVRGVLSQGMLCSEAEIGVGEAADAIIELSDDVPIGAPAASIFAVDPIIDFEVTPNRPDWLGVQGIARDLAAAGVGRRIDRTPSAVPGFFDCPISIRLDATDACPFFAGRVIKGLRNGPSPTWLQRRLKAIGLRPINALVDVTNYVAHDRARPLHVYDMAKLSGRTIVARLGGGSADETEHLLALDGKTYAIDSEMCVIADDGGLRPIGLGGVMGGESTGCSDTTVDVFVESAWFDPIRTAQTGRTTGITSDAQYRFARGVDPESAIPGLDYATKLILEFCGGEPSDIVVAGSPPSPPQPIEFDPLYVRRLTGLEVGRERILKILGDLGFGLEDHGPSITVTVPSWRRDVTVPPDLIEEIARICGYDKVPSTPLEPLARPPHGVLSPTQARARTARRVLAGLGYDEAVTWSFCASGVAELFGGTDPKLRLANPVSSELDQMRPSLLPNLIGAIRRNAARGFPDAALFEVGPIFRGDGPDDQRTAISGALASVPLRHWSGARTQSIFDVKSDLMALLGELGVSERDLRIAQDTTSPWWHPGKSARLQEGSGQYFAEIGEVHPSVLKAMDVEVEIIAFEVILEDLPEAELARKSRPQLNLSQLMPIRRDFAFLVPTEVPSEALVLTIQSAKRTLIESVRAFDVYVGPGVPAGSKSIAIEITIQPHDKTLTEAEIEAIADEVIKEAAKIGASLRA